MSLSRRDTLDYKIKMKRKENMISDIEDIAITYYYHKNKTRFL
jgi:hypothetical protein